MKEGGREGGEERGEDRVNKKSAKEGRISHTYDSSLILPSLLSSLPP